MGPIATEKIGDGVDHGGRRLRWLCALVAAEWCWLALQPVLDGPARWGPIAVVVSLYLHLVRVERREPLLAPTTVVLATTLMVAAAILIAPFGSRDLYQYAIYGRMSAAHGINPYRAGPSSVPDDPLVPHLAQGWNQARSVYGPAFTAISAGGALAYGPSPLLARLWFQGLAGLSLLAACILLHRRGAPSWVLVATGLSPVLVSTANGGHNDLLVGFLLLLGVHLLGRGRTANAAVILALACLVKLIAVPAVLAATVGLLATGQARRAGKLCAIVLGLGAAAYWGAGGLEALAPLSSVGEQRSRATPWALLRYAGVDTAGRWPVGALSSAVVAAALMFLAVRWWRAQRTPGSWRELPIEDVSTLAAALGVATCFAAAYSLPWYPAAFLPLAALTGCSVASRALQGCSLALLVVYVQPPGSLTRGLLGAPQSAVLASVLFIIGVGWTLSSSFDRAPRDGLTA